MTGSTGSVGRHVRQQLAEAGVPTRAAARTPGADRDAVPFDFADPSTFAPALDGVDRVFLMRPPAISDVTTYLRPFIALMAQRGVRHVSFLSVLGVNRAMPHWQVERDLESSGIPHTFVRPAFFTQNLASAYRDDIRDHDRIRLPAGSGRTCFIDTRDVAAVAVLALLDPPAHAGRAYSITGARAWSYEEVAQLLAATLGRPITYERVGFLRYRSQLRAEGQPAGYVRVQLLINAVARLGWADTITDTYPRLTGRDPIALSDSIRYLRAAWCRDT